ncbi:MAG: hypothetical protein ABJB03_00590 [Rhodoglobus sp.]
MGQNRRYGSDVSWAAIAQMVLRPRALSLGEAELGVDPETFPDAPAPVRVGAWVPFVQATAWVEGRAIAWTDRAVKIQFSVRPGDEYIAWVWADAVRRL